MTHFYERNITDIKQEYTIFLVNVLSPLIYEGIKGMYNEAKKLENNFIETQKLHPNVENPGIFKLFQKLLGNIQNLNNHHIENETIRLRDNSKIADIFDDLIRAVVKSNIVLLTYNASGKTCTLVKERYHENIDIKDFIHKCYIECAKALYDYPELFWHKFATIDVQRNKRECHEIIKKSINEAIRKIIPMKLILEEYLSKDYIKSEGDITGDVNEAEYMNIRNMLARDLHGKKDRKILADSDGLSSDSDDRNLDEDNDNNYSGGSDSKQSEETNANTNLENLILEGSSSEHNDNGSDDGEINKFDENDEPAEHVHVPLKEKDVQIDFGGRNTAANKMFQNALAVIDKPSNHDKVVPNTPVEVSNKKEESRGPSTNKHTDSINISRKGKIAHQGLKVDEKHIKEQTNTPQSDIMNNLLN